MDNTPASSSRKDTWEYRSPASEQGPVQPATIAAAAAAHTEMEVTTAATAGTAEPTDNKGVWSDGFVQHAKAVITTAMSPACSWHGRLDFLWCLQVRYDTEELIPLFSRLRERLLGTDIATWEQVLARCTAITQGWVSPLNPGASPFQHGGGAAHGAQCTTQGCTAHGCHPRSPSAPPFHSYPGGRRFPPELSFAVQPTDPKGSSRNMMYWAIHNQPPPQRHSLRALLRYTPTAALPERRSQSPAEAEPQTAGADEPPARNGIRPLPGESLSEWIRGNGWSAEEDVPCKELSSRVWGTASNHQPLLEAEVRELQSELKWKPHLMVTWLEWWAAHQSDVPAGSWVANVGTLHNAFKSGGRVLRAAKVQQQGPRHLLPSGQSISTFPSTTQHLGGDSYG